MNSAGVVIQDTTQTQARVFPELGNWSMFLPLALLEIFGPLLPKPFTLHHVVRIHFPLVFWNKF